MQRSRGLHPQWAEYKIPKARVYLVCRTALEKANRGGADSAGPYSMQQSLTFSSEKNEESLESLW